MNELASLTQQLCTSIMNRDIPIPEFPLHPYSEEQLQVGIVTILHVLTSVVFLVVESNEHYNYVLSEVIPNAMSHKCQECSLQLFSIVIIVYLLPDLRWTAIIAKKQLCDNYCFTVHVKLHVHDWFSVYSEVTLVTCMAFQYVRDPWAPIFTWLLFCVQIWIEYVPVKELRKLDMEFPLPDLSAYYRSDVCVAST